MPKEKRTHDREGESGRRSLWSHHGPGACPRVRALGHALPRLSEGGDYPSEAGSRQSLTRSERPTARKCRARKETQPQTLNFRVPAINLYTSLGATWLRRGSQNLRCMPRCRVPRKTICKLNSCQRRQLRSRRLKPGREPSDWSRACASSAPRSIQASSLTRSR